MSDKNQERIAAQEEYEREMKPRPSDGEFDEGMRELARLLGMPDTREGMREHMRSEERRRKLRIIGLVVGGVVLLVGAWLLFRLLT